MGMSALEYARESFDQGKQIMFVERTMFVKR